MSVVILILGLAVLILGGDLLVRGASGIALKLKMDPMVVGLTVVSLGTSAPELLVSLNSALNGQADIAVGNVIGSNIANLGLVLGLTAVVFPIAVGTKVLKMDWPVLVLFSGLFYAFGYDNMFSMAEGIALVILLAVYIFVLLRREKSGPKETNSKEQEDAEETQTGLKLTFFLIAGIVALYFGSNWFLDGAVDLGKNTFGLSEKIIGVTIVAFGTSAPELAASVIAAYRKQTDIALGNLVGSNIFNIGAVLGLTSIVTPLKTNPEMMNNDVLWMLGIAVILFPLMIFKKKLSIMSGIILFGLYVTYITLQLI